MIFRTTYIGSRLGIQIIGRLTVNAHMSGVGNPCLTQTTARHVEFMTILARSGGHMLFLYTFD